jgi:hypothetical protein
MRLLKRKIAKADNRYLIFYDRQPRPGSGCHLE